MRSKGPTPNTNKTIFAVMGVVLFSPLDFMILEFTFPFDLLLGIPKNII